MKRKPYNMKYTDLCIYIDKTIYERDENNNPIALRKLSNTEIENVYNYLYNIIYALSVKKKLFNKQQDYDDFSIETAGTLYIRLTAKNQNYDQNATSNRAIKSILNYIKGALLFMAITWRNTNYAETLNPEVDGTDDIEVARNYVYSQANDQFEYKRKKAFAELFENFPKYVNDALNMSMFKKNKLQKYQIALSEYLSLLNCLTIENKFKDISDTKKSNKIYDQLKNKKDYIINYSNDTLITKELIDLQLRKTLFLLEDEKCNIEKDYTPSDQELDNILATSFSTYGKNQKEE